MNRRKSIASVITAVFLTAILLNWMGAASAAAQENAAQAAEWLIKTHQNEDGGYASFSAGAGQAPSDVGGTVDALMALAAAGADVRLPLDFLAANADALADYAASDGGAAGKAILALAAAGQDPHDFAGQNLISALTETISPTGQLNTTTAFNQALALLALQRAGEPVSPLPVEWLVSLQTDGGDLDGSWDDGFGTPGNPDATAVSLMALTAVGVAGPAAERAADFLVRTQLASGGWEYGAGFGESANSTALAFQALAMYGVDVVTPDENGHSALNALQAWQGETGAFQADFGSGRFDDFFSTVQAIPALAAGAPVPVLISEPEAAPTATMEAMPTESPEPTPTITAVPELTAIPELIAQPTAVPEQISEPTTPSQPEVEPTAAAPLEPGQKDSGTTTAIFIVVVSAVLAGGGYLLFRRQSR